MVSCADPPILAPERASVAGTVFVEQTSGTIPKVTMRIADREFTTVTNGRFEFLNLEAGEYLLTADKAGYEPYAAIIVAYGQIQHDVRLIRVLGN